MHAALWWPLLKARSTQRAELGDLIGDDAHDDDESEEVKGKWRVNFGL